MTMLDTHPRSPFRAPDWRWIRATTLRHESLRPGRRDDGWVRRARRLQAAIERPGGATGHPRLAGVDPAILAGYGLRLGEPRGRWEVEARLLAGQGDVAIAARTGIPAEVVEAYEAIFYSVRDRLEAPDWIGAMILGPRLYQGLREGDVELAWKVVACNLGPAALEALIEPAGGLRGDERPEASPPTADRLRTALAALLIPVDEETAPGLIRLAARLREVEGRSASRSASAVLAPIDLAGRPDSRFTPAIGATPQLPSPLPAGFDADDRVGSDDGDELAAVADPLRFPIPDVEAGPSRKATA